MSERVVPDRYGYWIAKTVLGNEVVFRVFGGQGIPAVYADIRGGIHPVESFNGEWVASVADTQERLAAAEAELKTLKERIAAAPVAWHTAGPGFATQIEFNEPSNVFRQCNPLAHIVRVRLLEEPADA